MEGKYLIINAGSSSLKFSLYEMPSAKEIVSGIVEKIGSFDSFYSLKSNGKKQEKQKKIVDHGEAVETMLSELLNYGFINSIDEIKGVGHRVLHGGELYFDSVLIDEEVLNNIKDLTKLGPLHHPGEIKGIESMMKYLGDIPQVAVFDTAFHQSMPKEKFMYAVPYEWYLKNGVRKYGFHGTSHKYITETMVEKLGKEDVNLIICHLGSGASISAIKDGKCINTTMGLTPLDGLIMGTRSGAIDPSILEYMMKEENLSIDEINTILNKQSGLKGICGKNDFRDIQALAENGDERGKLAIEMFKDSVVKYIAEYYFNLNGNVDAIVFTAGIGENVSLIREKIVSSISNPMGIKLNKQMNENIAGFKEYKSGLISTDNSKIKVMVIPTNEEYMILKDTYTVVKNSLEKPKVKVK